MCLSCLLVYVGTAPATVPVFADMEAFAEYV